MSILRNKTLYSFGDSLMAGHYSGYGIMDDLCTSTGINYTKYAINGRAVVRQPYSARIIKEIDEASSVVPNFVVFNGMTNDAYADVINVSLGSITTTFDDNYNQNTFYGGFEHILYTLKHKYAESYIIYVTPHKMPTRSDNAQLVLHNAAVECCKKWDVAVVDIYKDGAIDTHNDEQRIKYSYDNAGDTSNGGGTHLTAEGYDLFYAPLIKAKMIDIQMETISDKLTILNTAKASIKNAIIAKGQTVDDNMNDYAAAIDNISGGGDNTDYLCFEAIEDSAISLSNFGDNAPNIEYSFDKSSWTTWDYSNIDIEAGQKLYMRGNNPNGFCFGHSSGSYSVFSHSGSFNISGNIMTLLDKSGELLEIPNDYCFDQLFSCENITSQADNIKSIMNLKLPATTLKPYCYNCMFWRNNSMTFCCTNLPAQYIPTYAYNNMFRETGIKESPYIMAASAYDTMAASNMFALCSNIQYVKAELTPSDTSNGATYNWLYNVPSTGCFIKAKDATWTTKSASTCPSGWTLITSVS